MKKVFLLLVLVLLVVPTVFGLENVITGATGNGSELFFSITTAQDTTNPTIGANIAYITSINITKAGAVATFNLSNFTYYLPDNASTQVVTDFKLNNGSAEFTPVNATTFTAAFRNAVVFSIPGSINVSGNGSILTINWSLSTPIAQTKIGIVKAGRRYTETWNITSSASNLTIENASLNVLPSYWRTRIGSPTVTFNSTAKNSLSTISNLTVYTDLNVTSGTGNLLEYGSGWGTLSVSYDGPTIDASSGNSATEGVIAEDTKSTIAFYWLIGIGVIFVVGFIAAAIYLSNPKRRY